MCYQNTMNELIGFLQKRELPYSDTILIGDNSSGKSELLKRLLIKSGFSQWYLIDSVNRYFNVGQIYKGDTELRFYEAITEHRVMEDNYNLKDSFYYQRVPTSIESFYFIFAGKIRRLFKQFLGVELVVKQSEVGYKIYLDNEESSLSSGYQALMRIFMEMEYIKHTMKQGCVVIDEIDEFLFPYNGGRIFEFLRQEYQEFSFLITTHSVDLIANAKDANIILLSAGAYEILDAGDFDSVSQVYNIFSSIFNESVNISGKEVVDKILRRLLNNKEAGIWTAENQSTLMGIKQLNVLTKAQKVLIRQIEE